MKQQTPPRSRMNHSNNDSLTMTPWQECMDVIRSLKSRSNKKREKNRPQRVLQEQSDEVEFIGEGERSLYGGTIVQGCLFEYLADKPEVTASSHFCIDDDDEDFMPEEGWGWSGRVALESNAHEQ